MKQTILLNNKECLKCTNAGKKWWVWGCICRFWWLFSGIIVPLCGYAFYLSTSTSESTSWSAGSACEIKVRIFYRYKHTQTQIYTQVAALSHTWGWDQSLGSLKRLKFSAEEPYFCHALWHKRPDNIWSQHIVDTLHRNFIWQRVKVCSVLTCIWCRPLQ